MPSFTSTLFAAGNNTGVQIPDEVMAELGGKRVPVVITLNGSYTYRTTTAVMAGRNLASFSSAHRAASGLAGGDPIEVHIEVDTEPREVELPPRLAEALADDAAASAAWQKLAPSRRKEHARAIGEAKTPETAARRLEKTLAELRGV